MMLGMSLGVFTIVHVAISLIAIAAGIVLIYLHLNGLRADRLAPFYLFTTFLTSFTGFMFPIESLTPGHIVGLISFVLLAFAVMGKYAYSLNGAWRRVYLLCSVAALYLNCFVAVVQSFQKLPFLRVLAPTQTEAPFAAAQLSLLLGFCFIGYLATSKSSTQAVNTQ